jgi:hypothetical protein
MKSDVLRTILLRNKINSEVVPRDEFQLRDGIHYIINSDPAYLPGQHWMCVYNGNPVEFFDPLGMEPNFYGLEEKLSIDFIYNRTKVQGKNSILCGEFCIYYLHMRCKGFSIASILETLSNSFDVNDWVVSKYVNKL